MHISMSCVPPLRVSIRHRRFPTCIPQHITLAAASALNPTLWLNELISIYSL